MIDPEIILSLTPEFPDEVSLEPDVEEQLEENPELWDLACWTVYATQELREFVLRNPVRPGDDIHPISYFFEHAVGIGIGIVDVYAPMPVKSPFRIIEGYQFGIAIYSNQVGNRSERRKFAEALYLPMRDRPFEIPVYVYDADLTEHLHPQYGFSSVVVDDGSENYLMTARHVVQNIPQGGSVTLDCHQHAVCQATVWVKGSGSVDAALLAPASGAPCWRSTPGCVPMQKDGVALNGMKVLNHFGSRSASVPATIMQGFHSPQTILVAVQPRNFIASVCGSSGDSGSVVSPEDSGHGIHSVIGMYLGTAGVRLANGRSVTRAFGLELNQPLRMFNVDLVGAFLK